MRLLPAVLVAATLSGCALFTADPETGVTPIEVGVTTAVEKAKTGSGPAALVVAIAAGIAAMIAAASKRKSPPSGPAAGGTPS